MPTRNAILSVACLLAVAAAASPANWPAYKADAARSGATSEQLKPPLLPLWRYEPPQAPRPAWPEPGKEAHRVDFDYAPQPVAAAGAVYFASSADDTVRALDAETGAVKWRFTAGGPIRFAPAIHKGRCYVACDDGNLHCLAAADGKLLWKFRAAPRDDMMLGNGRMISRWPIRTGVLVDDGVAYFAAGMWPSEGIYVYALDVETRKALWCNDGSGSMYINMPHPGASAFAGVAPQGYMLATDDLMLIPTGRNIPAAYDRKTGSLVRYRPSEAATSGGSWCTVAGDIYLGPMKTANRPNIPTQVGEAQPRDEDGLNAYAAAGGTKIFTIAGKHRAAARGNVLYAAGGGEVAAFDLARLRAGEPPRECVNWSAPHGRCYCIALAGNMVLVGGGGTVTCFDIEKGDRVFLARLDGQVRGLAVAGGRVFAALNSGSVVCLGAPRFRGTARLVTEPLTWRGAADAEFADRARAVIAASGKSAGYALVVGADAGRLATALAWQSDLHVIQAEADDAAAAGARRRLMTTDMYGTRVAVVSLRGESTLPFAPYFADLIVVAGGPGETAAAEFYRVLRPCGGVMCFSEVEPRAAEGLVKDAGVPAAEIFRSAGAVKVVRGKLPGAGDWRYQRADAGNTGIGGDTIVRTPLSLLWFGGPGPDRMTPRHWGASAPLSVNGRVFVAGSNHLICFDAYNGRELWARELRGAGRSGAEEASSNFVADDDSIYVAAGTNCYRLDQAAGATRAVYGIPDEFVEKPKPPAPTTRPKSVPVNWPMTWQVLGPLPKGSAPLKAEQFKSIPRELKFEGKTYAAQKLHAVRGVLDFSTLYGGFGTSPLRPGETAEKYPHQPHKRDMTMERKVAYAFAKFTCAEDGKLTIAAGADWWMEWFIDGKRVYETLEKGNIWWPTDIGRHVFTVDLKAGEHVIAVRVLSGSMGWCLASAAGADVVPLLPARPRPREAEWGYLSVVGDVVLASCCGPNLPRHTSRALCALDKHTGSKRWTYRSGRSFLNAMVAVGDGRVFLVEGPTRAELDEARRRGELEKLKYELVALDVQTGAEKLRAPVPAGQVGRFHLCYARGLAVLGAGTVIDAETGKVLWHRKNEARRPVVIHGEWILGEPYAYYLRSGERRMVPNIITGEPEPWRFVRAYGCGSFIGNQKLLLFRSGTAGIFDFAADGTTNFGGVRPNCSLSMIPANGLAIIPEGSSACTCSYSFQTSLALMPARRERDQWYVFQGGSSAAPVRQVRVNLGAPGDRRTPAGEAWLGYPRPTMPGACPVSLAVTAPGRLNWYSRPYSSAGVKGADRPWIYASGLSGVESVAVELQLRRALVVPKCKEAPTIDGKLDDACWQGLEPLAFYRNAHLEQPRVTLFVLRDAKSLYLAYHRAPAVRGGKPVPVAAKLKTDWGQWWKDDFIKIRLADTEGKDGLELYVTAGGAHHGTWFPLNGSRYTKWKGDWKSAVKVGDGEWFAEIAIPTADIVKARLDPKKLMINVASMNQSGVGPAEVALVPYRDRAFADPASFLTPVDKLPPATRKRFTVRLHFAELDAVAAGERVFDVALQGRQVLKGFDVFRAAGGAGRPVVREFKGIEAGNELTVSFTPKVGEPVICGVEVLREGDSEKD